MAKNNAKLQVGDQAHDLADTVTIGRKDDNMMVLDDESVSSHHAEIVVRDDLVLLRDLGSTNGTKVNGQSVTEVELKNGDVICFGAVEASFTAASQSSAEVPLTNERQQQASGASEIPKEPPGPSLGSKLASQGKAVWKATKENAAVASKETQTKLAHLGKVAWQETKRNSQLLSLKAQIEKLTRMDLRQAFHELGHKCYELKVGEGKFESKFQEIAALEQRIEEKRIGVHASEDAKSMEKLRAVTGNQASKVAAEALAIKLSGLFVALGKEAAMASDVSLPEPELQHMRNVEAHIAELEDAYSTVAAQAPAWVKKPTPRMLKWSFGAVAIVVVFAIGLRFAPHRMTHTDSPQLKEQATQTDSPQNKGKKTLVAWNLFADAIDTLRSDFKEILSLHSDNEAQLNMTVIHQFLNSARSIERHGIDSELDVFLQIFPDEMEDILKGGLFSEAKQDQKGKAMAVIRFKVLNSQIRDLSNTFTKRYNKRFRYPWD